MTSLANISMSSEDLLGPDEHMISASVFAREAEGLLAAREHAVSEQRPVFDAHIASVVALAQVHATLAIAHWTEAVALAIETAVRP